MSQDNIMIVGAGRIWSTLADDARTGTGLHVVGVPTVEAARSFRISAPDGTILAVVDATLPEDAALPLCADLARGRRSVPVMMVAAGHGPDDALRSFAAGAVDHFTRPDRRAELLARVQTHLRSLATSLDTELMVGPFAFHPGKRTLTLRDSRARIGLTNKETMLLRRLHLSRGRPVPAADLVETGWKIAGCTTLHTLHTHVYRLRGKLGRDAGGDYRLQTTRAGYVLAP